MTTPFEKAGYTKDTKFRVLHDDDDDFSKGDIVTLYRDDGSSCPVFRNQEGYSGYLYLPEHGGEYEEDLEVYEEEKPMTKQFKHPCAVPLEGLTQEQAINLEKAFVALGADLFESFTDNGEIVDFNQGGWRHYGVDIRNETLLYNDLSSYSDTYGESEVTTYTYNEVIELAGMTEPTPSDISPEDNEWIDNTGEEPQYLLDGGIIDVMFNNGSVLTEVTDDNRHGNEEYPFQAKDWSLFGDDSQIKAWRKAAVISSKEECDTSNPDVAVNAQSVSESNTESFKATMLIELTVCNEIFKLSKEEAYKIYSDLKDIFGE